MSAGLGLLLGAGGGLLAGTARPPLLLLETLQLDGVDQDVGTVLLRWQMAALDVAPEDESGHPDSLRSLGDRQQLSLLHADKSTESATVVIDYHGCLNPA